MYLLSIQAHYDHIKTSKPNGPREEGSAIFQRGGYTHGMHNIHVYYNYVSESLYVCVYVFVQNQSLGHVLYAYFCV